MKEFLLKKISFFIVFVQPKIKLVSKMIEL